MSNPIKSLLPTPLSMEFISDINALTKLPLPLYKFFINSALTIKSTPMNVRDQKFLISILKRQQIQTQIRSGSINSLNLVKNIAQKVLKLMKTSELQQIESNLQNCQKYIATVLSQNTLIDEARLQILLAKLATFIHDSLNTQPRTIQTKFGIVEWSLYNLKKTSLSLSSQSNSNLQSQDQKGQQKSNNNLKQINKMYVKVSFEQNFSTSGIQKLIQSGFNPCNEGVTECKIQRRSIKNNNDQNCIKGRKPKSITMSLIDFRLFMQELEKIKSLTS